MIMWHPLDFVCKGYEYEYEYYDFFKLYSCCYHHDNHCYFE